MFQIHVTLKFLLLSAVAALAATQHVAYTGGKQAGSFALRGTHSEGGGVTYPDTVTLDSAVRMVAFTEESYSTASGPTNYWFFLENSLGSVGFRNFSDTVWNEGTGFPSTPLYRDSIVPVQDPLGRFWPANLEGKRHGIKARRIIRGYEGTGMAYSVDPIAGGNRAIYFRINRSQGIRYGKIMVVRDSVHKETGPVIDGDKRFISVTVNYVMFSQAQLDTTPLALRPARAATSHRDVRLVWSEREGVRLRDAQGKFYDLHGKRVHPAALARPKE